MSASLKSLVKSAFFTIAPQAATEVMSARARAHSHKLVKKWGLFQLNQKLIKEIGNQVVSGPFKGLTLSSMSFEEHVGPYLLGTYEQELHPWWDQVFLHPFRQIVDVGAKFGYYAVGLARVFPKTPIVAFDTDWWARDAVREMATVNRAAGVSVQGFCSPSWLRTNLLADAFIISDCEGYERELFCTSEIPALATATMIIETHECFVPGVLGDIIHRFERSHTVRQVSTESGQPRINVQVDSLTGDELCRVSREVREPQSWVYLTPKSP
jgi:hypothetical protein